MRVDVTAAPGVEVGAAGYLGGTSRNRPSPDLIVDCPDGDAATVAPCGYLDAPLALAEAHAAVETGRWRGQALAVWGHLGNSAAITDRNRRLSNDLGVARTPVASQAYGVSVEAGVDVAADLGLCPRYQLAPFVRVERYDTMFRTAPGVFDNPRYLRTVGTAGVALTIERAITLKLDVAHRRFGATELRPETTIHAALGFIY